MTRDFVHCFYPPSSEKGDQNRFASLGELIEWISEDHVVRDPPKAEIIGLASKIALMVLQFHPKFWIQESWRSHDIQFFTPENFHDGISLRSPHLNIQFPPSGTKTNQDEAMNYIRNKRLFYLGIMLLELGLTKPWSRLREEVYGSLPEGQKNNYHAAVKMSQSMALVKSMGAKYRRIVRQCLGCDFGLGETDLSSDELRKTFLHNVVLPLEQLGEDLDQIFS